MVSDLSLCWTSLNFCLWHLDVLIFEVSFLNRVRSNPAEKKIIFGKLLNTVSIPLVVSINYQKTE